MGPLMAGIALVPVKALTGQPAGSRATGHLPD